MAYCEICNTYLMKRDEQHIEIPGTDETHCVCAGCNASIATLVRGTANPELIDICTREIISYLNTGRITGNLASYLISILPEDAVDEEEIKRRQLSREEREAEYRQFEERIKREEEEKRATFITTTGYKFDGYKITKYIKVVNGEAVMGGGMFKEFAASASDVFGTRAGGYESNLGMAKNVALYKAEENALAVGANGMIGIDYDIATIGNSMLVVSVTGTAVKIEKQE